MKQFFCTIMMGSFLMLQVCSQQPDLLPGNKSISIHYSLNPAMKDVFVSAKASSEHELLNGMNYNYGTAMKFKIYSTGSYYISLTSNNSAYSPTSSYIPLRQADINNYIYFKVVENNTGGYSVNSGNIRGEVLGKATRTIILNCPANMIPGKSESIPSEFGLVFKVYPGYSLPPGNYTTQVMITATYE